LDDPGWLSSLGQPVTNPRPVLLAIVKFKSKALADV
jgi:hypothetical protein